MGDVSKSFAALDAPVVVKEIEPESSIAKYPASFPVVIEYDEIPTLSLAKTFPISVPEEVFSL